MPSLKYCKRDCMYAQAIRFMGERYASVEGSASDPLVLKLGPNFVHFSHVGCRV